MASKKIKPGETGQSGVYVSNGVITGEEYNLALTGDNALKAYDQMRRNDASVRAALSAIKLPIKQADYSIDPASDDESSQRQADFVEECLFRRVNFKQFLGEALTSLDFGFSVFEMVFEPVDMLGGRYMALTKLGFRKQSTINKWITESNEPGITQHLVDGTYISIPEEKLAVFTQQQEGDNRQGISVLRTAYKHWKIKDQLYKIDAVGHERHALGVLEIEVPPSASEKDKKAMRKIATNLRANQSSYVEHPSGWTVQFMDMKAGTLKDVKPSIDHHDRQIMKNVLAQFLEIGASGSSGTRNVSEDHSRLFELSVQEVVGQLVQTLQNTVVRTLIDLNFADVKDYPTLRVGKISDDNVPVMSEAIAKFVEAGVLHARPADENSVRKMIGFAEVKEDELDALFAQPDGDVTPLTAARALHASLERKLYGESLRAA